MGTDRDAVLDAQHARLLEGLAESIREKGLAATQVTDIVRHAHASRRTFYNHFDDKESCFVELTEALSSVLLETVDQAIDRDAPLATQIDQAIDAYVDTLAEDPGLTATFASPTLGERVVVAQHEGVERYAQLLVSVVAADAAREPGVAPVSLLRAYMLVSGCQQTIMRAVARGEDLGEVASEVKAVMKSALAARPAAVS
jgi:AcrR family transcriptional regulator